MKAMNRPYRKNMLAKQIRQKRAKRKERIQNDLETYGSEILHSDEMKQAFAQTHHLWSTVGEHSLRVAASSVMICYALKKLKVKVNLKDVVVGSLAHDLGMLGRKEKFRSARQMSREHPRESVSAAREILNDLPETTEDIIERHMWPLGKSKMPNSIEGVIVSVADKYIAVKDLALGSEVKHTGVKNFVHDQKDKVKKTMHHL